MDKKKNFPMNIGLSSILLIFVEVLRTLIHGSGLTLAIRNVLFTCTSFSYVLLRLNHCHVSKYAAPRQKSEVWKTIRYSWENSSFYP